MLAFFWLLSLVLALVVAVPYGRALAGSVSRWPDPAETAARVGVEWHDDFRRANAPALSALADVAGAVTWFHALLVAVLAGGVIAAFDRREVARRREEGRGWSYRVFLADSGRWAWPMFRLFLIALPLFYLVDLAVNVGLGKLFDHLFADRAYERIEVLATWWRQVILLSLLWVVATWIDLARVRVVIDRRRSALLALSGAVGMILRQPAAIVAVSLSFLALELVAIWAGSCIAAGFETGSWARLLTWLGVAQLLVLVRIGLGFGRLAGYVAIAEEEREEREAKIAP